jgi:hypothetical protein
MGSTAIPALDGRTGEVTEAFWCKGCEHQYLRQEVRITQRNDWEYYREWESKRMKAFSKVEFLAHFEECKSAKRLLARLNR